ncbi:hypothetical protein NHX12_026983 [Muraenolepis orangiensis]|uniref:PH domain-containing protein n=1 Tax=Muraenolepis orangiensis TaxID=630683 RepID=A0A9Q0ILG2_9TELE|nr:hypothetical protein NHX12_026983 [Muraenolepis orangiensis]
MGSSVSRGLRAVVLPFLIGSRAFVPQQNLLTMEQILTVEETQIKDKKCILLRIKGGKQFVLQCESDPEFVQWKKELTDAFTEAQKLLRRAPKVIGKGRAGLVELSKPPLTHRNSNGL